jgi:hypothetical protein
MTAAKHRALDALRNSRRAERKQEQLGHETRAEVPADFERGASYAVQR